MKKIVYIYIYVCIYFNKKKIARQELLRIVVEFDLITKNNNKSIKYSEMLKFEFYFYSSYDPYSKNIHGDYCISNFSKLIQ